MFKILIIYIHVTYTVKSLYKINLVLYHLEEFIYFFWQWPSEMGARGTRANTVYVFTM
jgi:hypothetical protein